MESSKTSNFMSALATKLFGAKMDYRLRYLHNRGHLPNLRHPKDMSEILISKMFDRDVCKELGRYVDKLGVREYVKEKGLEEILLNHYGVWETPEQIDFEALPQKFVLKSNNGCGHHVICRDKNALNREEAMQTLHLAIESGVKNVEPHYHFITPRVYAEELIETSDGTLPIDYKFTCIGGEIMDVFVATERAISARYSTMDLEWNTLPYTKKEYQPKQIPPAPKHIDQLAEVARILSKDFDFVRVDLYEYKDKPYISELTFFPWGAMLYSYTDDAIKFYGEKYWERKGI